MPVDLYSGLQTLTALRLEIVQNTNLSRLNYLLELIFFIIIICFFFFLLRYCHPRVFSRPLYLFRK